MPNVAKLYVKYCFTPPNHKGFGGMISHSMILNINEVKATSNYGNSFFNQSLNENNALFLGGGIRNAKKIPKTFTLNNSVMYALHAGKIHSVC